MKDELELEYVSSIILYFDFISVVISFILITKPNLPQLSNSSSNHNILREHIHCGNAASSNAQPHCCIQKMQHILNGIN